MPGKFEIHMQPEEIERYSEGESMEEETARWDEHLLVCADCRRRVSEHDEYRLAMRSAARELRQRANQPARRSWRLIPVWIPACALLATMAIIAAALLPRWRGPVAPFAVSLTTARGQAMEAHAPERTPLNLNPDLTGLPARAAYRLELVNEVGEPVSSSMIAGGSPKFQFPGLAAGIYFARIYGPDGALLREYGLIIEPRPKP